MAHFKPFYPLLFTVCGVSLFACVEPPASAPALCLSEPSENICRREETADYKACCESLNTIEGDGPFDELHQSYFIACIDELEESKSETRCFETEEALSMNWNAQRIVGACSSLFAGVSELGKREDGHVLPCIENLTQLSKQDGASAPKPFVPLHAQDPFAVALFCAKLNRGDDTVYTLVSDNTSYTRDCINVLSQYAWFPADPQNTLVPLDTAQWGKAGNQITALCAEFLQTCGQVEADQMLACLSAFSNKPDRPPMTSASSFIAKMFLSPDDLAPSCYTCDEDNKMSCRYLDNTECDIIMTSSPTQSECR